MLYRIASDGSVVNEASLDKIQPEYTPLLEEISTYYKDLLGERLLSIYIRGSVSVGRAQAGVSDIDSVAITKEESSEDVLKEIFRYSCGLQKKYPFVTLVDMTVISLETLMSSPDFSNLKIYLKTQSVCLYGEDVVNRIDSVRPGPELALKMNQGLSERLKTLEKYFLGEGAEMLYLGEVRTVEFWCVWTMRTIIRSALGLVMMKEPVYSQDLKTCAEIFVRHYPEYKQYMDQAINWAMKPTQNKNEVVLYLKEFCPKYIALWQEETLTLKGKWL